MNLAWCVWINLIIGIILFIPILVVFHLIHYHKYGKELCEEAIDNYTKQNMDIIYASYKNPKRTMALSAMATLLLWEILLPMSLDLMHQAIVELYNARNKP